MTERATFGAELRRWRELAQWSQAELARQIHYSKGHLSKVESGDKPPNATLAKLCDAALHANGALIALAAERPSRDAGVDTDPGTGEWQLRLGPDGSGRYVRTVGDVFTDGGTTFGPGHGADRLPADPSTLITLFTARFDQARSLGQVLSPALVLPGLLGETHSLRIMAAATPSGESAGLWQLAARFAEFVGWMVQEQGDDREAMWWTEQAREMAARDGDESMRPWALFRRSDTTILQDDPHTTIDLARRAQLDPAATARVRGLAAQREAQGYALLGRQDDCLRALDLSARLLDEAKVVATSAPILGTTRTPDPTAMARGWCLYDLGHPAEAAALLEPGITFFAPGASRARARYGLRTALAYAVAGELERPCDIVEMLADDLRQIDSATVRHDLRLLHGEFRRRSTAHRVRDLLPVLADLLRGPGHPVGG